MFQLSVLKSHRVPPTVTCEDCRCSEVLEDRLGTCSPKLPCRCPDRNSISWQDLYVVQQPANLPTRRGDARGVHPNLCVPEVTQPDASPKKSLFPRSNRLFTEGGLMQ